MNNEWYIVEGIIKSENVIVDVTDIKLRILATSIEDACVKAREFFKPLAEFISLKCYLP